MKYQRHAGLMKIRGEYGKSSKVTYAHLEHRLDNVVNPTCEFCTKEAQKSAKQIERQRTRQDGKYATYALGCEECGAPVGYQSYQTIEEEEGGDQIILCEKCYQKWQQAEAAASERRGN